jgi:hypothetical protein
MWRGVIGSGSGLFTPAKSGIQWRILFLLNGYLRFLTVTISGRTYHDDAPNVSNIAVLKREEGIGRSRNRYVFATTAERSQN